MSSGPIFFYFLAFLAFSVVHSLLPENPSPYCLSCICLASSDCNQDLKCPQNTPYTVQCGAYGITKEYWEAGNAIGYNYETCANFKACAERVIINYARKYGRDCNGDDVIDCIDYAAIHIMGSEYCDHPSLLNTEYWLAFQQSRCYQYPNEPEEVSYESSVRNVYRRPNSSSGLNRITRRPPHVSVPIETNHQPMPVSRPTFVPRFPTNQPPRIIGSGHVFVNGSELVILPIVPSETTVPEATHPVIIYPNSDSDDNHSDSTYPENTDSEGTYPEYPENSNTGNTHSEDTYRENTHTERVYPLVEPVTHLPENRPSIPSVTNSRIVYPEITEPVNQPSTSSPITHPPVTRPSVTRPLVTRPPLTRPSVTRTPITRPPVTRPPVTRPGIILPPANPGNNFKPTSPPNVAITNPPTTRIVTQPPLSNENSNLVTNESFTSESPSPAARPVTSSTVSPSLDRETDNSIPSSNGRPSVILPPWAARFNETKYVPNECLECLCEASNTCEFNRACDYDQGPCGPFQLTYRYWNNAGSSNQNFHFCASDNSCSRKTVRAFMKRYAFDCNEDHILDCIDYALIHRLGPERCKSESNDFYNSEYWENFQNCFGFMAR